MDAQAHISRELLRWYVDMGVDETLSTDSTDWYAQSELAAPPPVSKSAPPPLNRPPAGPLSTNAPSRAPTPLQPAAMPPDGAVVEARERAGEAKNLEELEQIIRGFEGCGLKATAKNTCISRGSPEAKLMFIGEAPGRDEDIQGRPFVGRAGQLLDKMLNSIERDETNAYITNIVYWRPPGNRTPTPQEAQICRPFLVRQIQLIDPDIIVFLGGAAAKHMLEANQGIMKLRGKWKSLVIDDKEYKSMATLHPAYLLRNPAGKKLAWRDFLNIKKELQK